MRDGAPWTGRLLGSWLRRNRDKRRSLDSGAEVYVSKKPGLHQWALKLVNSQLDLYTKPLPVVAVERVPGEDDIPF